MITILTILATISFCANFMILMAAGFLIKRKNDDIVKLKKLAEEELRLIKTQSRIIDDITSSNNRLKARNEYLENTLSNLKNWK